MQPARSTCRMPVLSSSAGWNSRLFHSQVMALACIAVDRRRVCRRATREERAARGERVKASSLPVHTCFKEMHERGGRGTGDVANMIPEGHTLQLEFFRQVSYPGPLRPPAPRTARARARTASQHPLSTSRLLCARVVVGQNDEVFPDEGVAGVTEMRWDDAFKKKYETRPITKAIIEFYKRRVKKDCPHKKFYGLYRAHDRAFVVYVAAQLFWGFGFRFTLRDASSKAVKLSDLDMATFKGLTLDEAPFGRMT